MTGQKLISELRDQAKVFNTCADMIEGKIAHVKGLRTTTTRTTNLGNPTTGSGRTLSAAARKRIAAAQRKRWALVRGGKKAA